MFGMFVALFMSGVLLVACSSDSGTASEATPDTTRVANTTSDTSGETGAETTGTPVVTDTEEGESTSDDASTPQGEDTTSTGTEEVTTPPQGEDVVEIADTTGDDVAGPDECDGAWESCCLDGVVSTCCCPDGMACNYGMFETCEDGSCVAPMETCKDDTPDTSSPEDTSTPDAEPAPSDAEPAPSDAEPGPSDAKPGPSDASEADAESCDGTWQGCCIDGALTECCCPEGAICNYFYEICEDGSCTFPGEPCVEPEPECDGNWETCCIEGTVDQCCCPEGAICNYGMFQTCDDGSCVGPGQECAPPEPQCDGDWQSCCVDGAVSECCCPEGMACNYGMFQTCEDGSCVAPFEECKDSQ